MIVVISSFYSALKSSKKVQNNSWNHFSPKKTAKTTIWRNVVQKYWKKYHILKMLFFELGATKLHFFVSWGTLLCLACLLSVHFVAFATTYNIQKHSGVKSQKMFSSFYKIVTTFYFSCTISLVQWYSNNSNCLQHLFYEKKIIFFDIVCFVPFLCM